MRKNTKVPCFGCTLRKIGCHSNCTKDGVSYEEWSEERRSYLDERNKNNMVQWDITALRIDSNKKKKN